MQSTDLFSYSLRNIRRGWSRAALAMTAVAIGVFAVVVIASAGNGGQNLILREVERLGLRGLTVYTREAAGIELCQEDAVLASGARGVETVMPVLLEYTTYEIKGSTGGSVLWGVSEDLPQVMDLELLKGRFFTAGDLAGKASVVIIDDTMAQKVMGTTNVLGETITVSAGAGKAVFTVIGVVASQKAGLDQLLNGVLPQFLYLPYDTLAELSGRSEFDQLAISCMADSDPDAVGEAVVKRLDRAAGMKAYQYQNISGYREGLESITELVEILISAIAAISLVVAGLCVMNSMLSAATERKQEIGICMAIGAQKGDILRCFLVESAITSAMGGLMGAGAAAGLLKLGELVLKISLPFSWSALLIAELVSIGLGILFGLVPARKAANMDPIRALRGE